MFRRLRGYFLSGLLVVVPIGATIWIIWGIFNLFDGWYRKLAFKFSLHQNLTDYYHYFPEYGVGFFLTLSLIVFFGVFTQLYIGRKVFALVDWIFLRIPVVSKLYNGVKQVTETIMGRNTQIFERVVLLEYPRKGVYSLAFVTGNDQHFSEKIHSHLLNYVFVPKTPNITTGVLLIVPEEELIPVNMSIEDAMKMIISGGMLAPRRSFDSLDLFSSDFLPSQEESRKTEPTSAERQRCL